MQLLSFILVWLAALAPAQQSKARVEFFARPDGASVRGAVRIKITPGWHLYGAELGSPTAIGTPTKLTFSGAGVRWGQPRFPPADKEEQPFGTDDEPTTIDVYRGTVIVYVKGELADGADIAAASVHVAGQTCEEDGVCIQFDADAKVSGSGPDAVFEKFPGDLVVASASDEGGALEPFEDPQAHARVELFTRAVDSEARAAIRITIDDEWHLYHEELGPPDALGVPTEVELGGAGIRWSEPIWPAPHRAEQPIGFDNVPTWIWQHEGEIVLYARGEFASGADVSKATVSVTGETCDPRMCLPLEARVVSKGKGPDELFAKFPAEGAQADGGNAASSLPATKPVGLLEFLGLAVFWGIFSLLMPCTYPMIPITISFFTKQASQDKGKRIALSLLYGLGIVLIFILIGVVIGAPIIQFATHPVTNLVIGAFFVVFALSLLGLFNLEPPAFLMNMAGRARMTGGYLGVFFMGATLVVTSFTCTAPFVGSLLSFGASSGNLGRVVLGMGTFGLTMAVPFVVLSLIPGKLSAMPRSGEWMNTLKVTLGFVEFAAALKFFSNADVVYQWGLLPREMFLLLWFGILVITALYLFGVIRYHGDSGEVGGGRLLSGTLFFLFALYCLFGGLGNRLDIVMTAIAPPYSAGRVAGFEGDGAAAVKDHEIVKDDYGASLARAKEQGKLVLVNFTGFT